MAEGRRATAGRAGAQVLRPLLPLLWSALLLLGAAPAAAAPSGPAPVVVVGVPGLLWSDVSPDTTPHLWETAGEASIGNVSIRSATPRTCPTDGWLTVSAGQRALAEREVAACEPAPTPQSNGSGASVPGFDSFADDNRASEFAAPVGLLGQTVSEAGGTTLAVGPGAADDRGHVDHYLSDPADLTADRLDGVSLAAVELAGVAVTVMMIAGVRFTFPRVFGIAALALGSIALLSWWDFLRPVNERSHFGAFAAQVTGGDAVAVLTRKLTSMLGTLGNWQLTLLAGCALVFLFLVLRRPRNWRIGALQRAYEDAPMLRAGLTGSLVCALVGFAANDSGVAIPAIALTVAVPLTLSACVWATQAREEEAAESSVPIADATRA